ncbi:MAG: hypothetical protein ACTSPY_03705 [Candidatus Helarchaeota archaeon]
MSDTFFLRVEDSQENNAKLEYLSQVVEKVMEIILRSIEQLTMGLENLENNIYAIQNRIPVIEKQIDTLTEKQKEMEMAAQRSGTPLVEVNSTTPPTPQTPTPINASGTSQPKPITPKPAPQPRTSLSPRTALNDELKSLFAKMRKK